MVHRVGESPPGDVSVLIAVSSVHREEAMAAARFGINELKASVPIWKKVSSSNTPSLIVDTSRKEIYANGDGVWKENKEAMT